MVADEIPEVVQRLIADKIDSIPELEAILLLRENPAQEWTAVEAGRRLYVSTTVAEYILRGLSGRGLLRSTADKYRYSPEPKLSEAVDQLALTYARHLVAVTRLVHGKPTAVVRHFADAFLFRKDK